MPNDPAYIICMGLLSLTLFKQHLVFVTNQNKQRVLPMRKGGKKVELEVLLKQFYLGKGKGGEMFP